MPKRVVDIVIPAYNEVESIRLTIEALFRRFAALPYRFEVIVVDDGSHDGTADVVREYVGRLPVTLVELTRNFGKETALLAGTDLSRRCARAVFDPRASAFHERPLCVAGAA